VDFIDKKDITVLQVCKNSGKVAGAFYCWARSDFDITAHFIGDDVSKSGLA